MEQTNKDSPPPTTQSDSDSRTDPHQALNTWRSCNAVPSHGRRTGFEAGRAGMRHPLPWFRLSDDPSRYSCRTTKGCYLYQSSLFECRFGRSGSSGFLVGFRRLYWCGFDRWNRVRAYHNALTQDWKLHNDSCLLLIKIILLVN